MGGMRRSRPGKLRPARGPSQRAMCVAVASYRTGSSRQASIPIERVMK